MGQKVSALLAACGLYCGACYHYRASFYDDERLRAEATGRGYDTERFTCQGCRSGMLNIFAGCAQCEIRASADRKGFPHCGLCMEFPCDPLRAFQNDGHLHTPCEHPDRAGAPAENGFAS